MRLMFDSLNSVSRLFFRWRSVNELEIYLFWKFLLEVHGCPRNINADIHRTFSGDFGPKLMVDRNLSRDQFVCSVPPIVVVYMCSGNVCVSPSVLYVINV